MNRSHWILGQGFALAATFASLAGCGGGGDGGGSSGTVTFAITDAASDEIESFTVDVQSVRLRKPTGAIVSVLSQAVRVDLAELTDTSRLLSMASVPAGTYTSAELTLDFTNAQCVLVGQTTPATILDAEGNAVTGTLDVPIAFATPLPLHVNRHKLLELDFAIDESLSADTGTNSVSFEPALHLRVDPSTPKPIATFGTLVSVDAAHSTFVAAARSFADQVVSNVTFETSAQTLFHVDGVPASGAAGLGALALLPADAWIQAYGTIDPVTASVATTYVEAGAGTFNGGDDIIEGYVTARAGAAGADPTFTILGRSQNAAHDTFQFDTTFQVSASFTGTQVVQWASATGFDTDDINVGQHVRVFGTLGGTVMGSSSVIRMQPTFVFGHSVGAPSGTTATMAITRVGTRDVGVFQWNQGGTTPPDPLLFVSEVGGLAQGLNVTDGDGLVVRGFFTPIDAAGSDFDALSLIDLASVPSLLLVRNRVATGFDVAVTTQTSSLSLAITGSGVAGEFAVVGQPFVGTTALASAPTPTITPAGGVGLYSIRERVTGAIDVFTSFSSFQDSLGMRLGLGAQVVQVGAVGSFNATTNSISAGLIGVVLE